jgi:hypothetical protein
MTPRARLPQFTVRRRRANELRSSNDFVVRGDDLRTLDRQLREALRTAQAERGTGPWLDADPEVWQSGTLIGRLANDGDIAQLVRLVMGTCAKARADRSA